jgi:hypothetical protein
MAEETPPETRVSISLSTLRAELTSLELRLVDRLNGALANKADRNVLDQISARQSDGLSRLAILEQKAVLSDGPLVQQVADHAQQLQNLQAVGGYKKWLWAQTVALIAIAIPLVLFILQDGAPA